MKSVGGDRNNTIYTITGQDSAASEAGGVLSSQIAPAIFLYTMRSWLRRVTGSRQVFGARVSQVSPGYRQARRSSFTRCMQHRHRWRCSVFGAALESLVTDNYGDLPLQSSMQEGAF
jgi:hypothetical protein